MENEVKCKKCGATLGAGDKFCPQCGYSEVSGSKGQFKKILESPFFTLAKPYLDFIAKEKLYSLVYFAMAAISLLIPFLILYKTIDSGFFKYVDAKMTFAFIFMWLFIAFACWVGSQLWLDRQKNVTDISSAEFIAIPGFSEILQTFGEWLGTLFAVIGVGGTIVALIFLGNNSGALFSMLPGIGSFMSYGAAGIIICPVIGILIMVFFRIMAELLRILAALANNTKEIAKNIKNNSQRSY